MTPTLPDHSDREHAEHSPSSLKLKEICPGFTNEPDDERWADFADEGSLMHAAAESGDLSTLNVDQKHFVKNVLEYVERVTYGATKTVKEQRLYASDPLLRAKAHGTPDRLDFMDPSFMHLIDYKFGRRPVDHASRNVQGFAYAVAAFDTFPELQFIHVHFLAPRLADGFTNHVFERSVDYPRMFERVKRIVQYADAVIAAGYPYNDLQPNFETCIYCGLRATCRPLADRIKTILTYVNDNIDLDALEKALCNLDNENEQELSLLFKAAKVVKAWAEAYEQHTLNKHLNEGMNVDGYELRFRKGKTSIVDTPKAAKVLADTEGLSLDTILSACDLNTKKLETILATNVDEDQIPEIRKRVYSVLAKAGVVKQAEESQYLYKLNRNHEETV